MTTTSTTPALSIHEAVDDVRNRHISAVNSGDVQAAASLFAVDAVFLPPGQPAIEGTASIQAWFNYVFGQFNIRGFSMRPGDVAQYGDIMIEHGGWEATFEPKDGSKALPAGGTYLTVYAGLSDGRVLVIRDTFNGLPA